MSDQDPNKPEDDFPADDLDFPEDDFMDLDEPLDDSLDDPLGEDFEDDFNAEEFDDADLDYLDEDWDDDLSDQLTQDVLAKEKKSYDFNKIVITGAVIIGLCVLAYQVMTNRPDAVQQFRSALNMTGATDGPVFGRDEQQQNGPDSLNIGQGFLDDPSVIDPQEETQAETQNETPPMPVPIAQAGPQDQMIGQQDTVLTPLPEAEGFVDASQASTENIPRSPDTPPADMPDAENRAQALLEDTLARRAEDQNVEEDAQQASLEGGLEDGLTGAEDPLLAPQDTGFGGFDESLGLEEDTPAEEATQFDVSVERIETDTETQQETITAPEEPVQEEAAQQPAPQEEVAAAPVVQESEEVTDEVAEKTDLEKEIEQIEARLETTDPQNQSEIEDIRAEIAKLKRIAEKVRETQQRSATIRQTASTQNLTEEAAEQPAPRQTTSVRAPARTTTRWVLRAAQPGKAWVSRPGEKDMQSLVVGDQLAGIGTIREIAFENGRWVVKGTRGRINQ